MSKEDLIPFNKRTEAEQKAIAKMGGIRSGEVRRQQSEWAKMLDFLGKRNAYSKKNRDLMSEAGIDSDKQTSDMAKMFVLDIKSQSGDPKSIELEAKIRGQFAPTHNVNENFDMELPKPRLAKDRSEKED